MRSFLSLPFVLAFVAVLAPASRAEVCAFDPTPAATLLVPYFEVDLGCAPGRGTTIVSLTNALPDAVLAHVTLWSDWSVPVLDFDVYLTGFDVERLDLGQILCGGNLPTTGSALSPHGDLSGPPVEFPSCNNTAQPGDPPGYVNPAISSGFKAHLHAWLTGQQSPATADCAGRNHGDQIARGYVTVDVTNDCSIRFPSEPGYFENVASSVNALLGEYFYYDVDALAVLPAVHVEAGGAAYGPGQRSFYGRYVGGDGSDLREPLPSIFGARFVTSGPVLSRLLIWREADADTAAVPCGTTPAWHPLPPVPAIFFDEEENAVVTEVSLDDETNPYEVVTEVANPFSAGWVRLDLRHPGLFDLYDDDNAQGWVTVAYEDPVLRRPASALHAPSLDSFCLEDWGKLFVDGFETGDTNRWSSVVP